MSKQKDSGSESVFTQIMDVNYSETAVETDPEEFEKVARSRRSVRVYDGSPVPEDVMRKCLELALLAPNSSNLQCWEFYWVRSTEKKKKAIEYFFSQPSARTAAEIVVAVGRIDTWRGNSRQMVETFDKAEVSVPKAARDYYTKLVHLVYPYGFLSLLVPFKYFVSTVVGFFRPMQREPLGKKDMQIWAAKSSALACLNLMLAFRAYGYDTCPMEGMDSTRMKRLLGVPRNSIITMGISVGKRSPKGVYGPQVRFESKQFLFEV